jgi:hypothetical protein
MNKLNTVMSSLSEARTNKDAAKDRWLTALEDGSEDQAPLKQAFHAADEIWANGAQSLAQAITDLKNIFCFELALSLLSTEETETLRKLLADLRLDHMTDPRHNDNNLNGLAETWYRAEGMREAAKTIHARFNNREQDETIASILADLEHARKPEAWTATAEAFNFIDAAMPAQDTEEDGETGDALISSVLHFLNRHLLKHYDDLTERLADKLEDAYYAGNISFVLQELEPNVSRVIQDALSSGIIRQRQPQAEEQTETRGVAIAEAEAEAEADDEREGETEQ